MRRGRRVVLVGPRERPGSGSQAAVGVASVKGNFQGYSDLFREKLGGQVYLARWLEDLETASGMAISRLSGTVEPYQDLTGYEAIRERVFHRLFTGCHGVEVLSQKTLTKFLHSVPGFPGAMRGGFLYPRDLWVDPDGVVAALEAALARSGVEVRDFLVRRIAPHPDRGVLIEGLDESLHAEEAVVAVGAFAPELLRESDLRVSPLESVAGETLLGDAPPAARGVINRGKVNLALFGGRYLYGSSSRLVRKEGDAAPSSFFAEELTTAMQAFTTLPAPTSVRWGLRSRFKDQAPGIGPLFWSTCERRVWAFLGFYKSGLQLAPWLATKLASALEDGNYCLPSAFDPRRR